VTLDELVQLGQSAPGLRGPELLDWGRFIQGGGTIYPLSLLTREGEMIPPPPSVAATTAITPLESSSSTIPPSADTASSFSSSSSLVQARVAADSEGEGSGISEGGSGDGEAKPCEDLTTSVTGVVARREATTLAEERGSS
jgi:hypothetical protein